MAKNERVAAPVKSRSVVTFFLGKEECGVPITGVHQIIRDVPITRVPNVSPHVEGVLNLRGVVVPIIDLKHVLGLGTRSLGDEHRLIIMDHRNRMVGFSADRVGGVFQFDESLMQAAPDVVLARVSGRFVRGVVRRGESIVILLDFQEVLSSHDLSASNEQGTGVTHRVMARSREDLRRTGS
jgi:purine-binding chemotaxis protein CheW